MTLAHEQRGVRIYGGHVLDVLRELPSASVHCVVTSPPYWSLRDYGTPPQVWSGDAHEHEWRAMSEFGATREAPVVRRLSIQPQKASTFDST